ncbi:MAG: hypothetical protein K5886_04330 [Lachnospiraceae bacterium]|nr:hypothetical protein [Lachnospiraceae bacterium]
MAVSMDTHVKTGDSIKKDLEKGDTQIEKIGEEFKGVKDGLKGMPAGIDSDLDSLIKDIETSGRAEAMADIQSVESSVIDTAKTGGDSLKTDVQSKITDNNTAKGKLDSINSKYGRDSVAAAKTAIDANTKKGDDLLKELGDVIKSSDTRVQNVKDSL